MYTASFIKYASHAFDVVPVVREGREIALSIGKINDEERTELITGREFGKRKEKRKIAFIVIFRGEKEGRIFCRWYLSASSIYSRSVITGDLIGSIERKRGISHY